MTQLTQIKVFLASPPDTLKERRIVASVIAEINRTLGDERQFIIKLVTWETDATPGHGNDGQSLLNKQIAQIAQMDRYTLFVGNVEQVWD
jgi:hypothetical protein